MWLWTCCAAVCVSSTPFTFLFYPWLLDATLPARLHRHLAPRVHINSMDPTLVANSRCHPFQLASYSAFKALQHFDAALLVCPAAALDLLVPFALWVAPVVVAWVPDRYLMCMSDARAAYLDALRAKDCLRVISADGDFSWVVVSRSKVALENVLSGMGRGYGSSL